MGLLIKCDTCAKMVIEGEAYEKFVFPLILEDGKITKWYAESYICSDCIIKVAKLFSIKMKESVTEVVKEPVKIQEKPAIITEETK